MEPVAVRQMRSVSQTSEAHSWACGSALVEVATASVQPQDMERKLCNQDGRRGEASRFHSVSQPTSQVENDQHEGRRPALGNLAPRLL